MARAGWVNPFAVFWTEAPRLGHKLKNNLHRDYITRYGIMINRILKDLRVKKGLNFWREAFLVQFWNDILHDEFVDPYWIISDITNDDIIHYQWKFKIPDAFDRLNSPVFIKYRDYDLISGYIKDCWNEKISFDKTPYNKKVLWEGEY